MARRKQRDLLELPRWTHEGVDGAGFMAMCAEVEAGRARMPQFGPSKNGGWDAQYFPAAGAGAGADPAGSTKGMEGSGAAGQQRRRPSPLELAFGGGAT